MNFEIYLVWVWEKIVYALTQQLTFLEVTSHDFLMLPCVHFFSETVKVGLLNLVYALTTTN